MTDAEIDRFVRERLTLVFPNFAEWRKRVIAETAAATGLSATDVAEGHRENWRIALASSSLASAEAALTAIRQGRLDPPAYTELPRWFARQCRDYEPPIVEAPGRGYAEDRRVDCSACCDSGFVVIVNPHFVEAHREQLLSGELDYVGRSIIAAWLKNNERKYDTTTAHCNCQHGQHQREMQKTPMVQYEPRCHVLFVAAPEKLAQRCRQWCEEHETAGAWQLSAEEYQQEFVYEGT